jgi:hypothetical protein
MDATRNISINYEFANDDLFRIEDRHQEVHAPGSTNVYRLRFCGARPTDAMPGIGRFRSIFW